MRFAKVIGLVLLFVISMLFFVQNTPVLSETMQLRLDLFFQSWKSIPLPFYFLLLLGVLAGALFCTLYFIGEKRRQGKALRQCRAKLASLQQEVNSLRNLPLENDYSSGEQGGSGESGEEEQKGG
jgi:uncharacterized integral membrane protein